VDEHVVLENVRVGETLAALGANKGSVIERPFACKECNSAFTTAYILKNHMLVHTGERAFK